MRFIMTACLALVLALGATARTPARAAASPMDWSGIVHQVLPAVVNISIETIQHKNGSDQLAREVGTGFLVDSSGTIATNKHVIAGAFRITVTLSDGSQWDAKLLGAARMLDIAIVKIDVGHPLPFLTFADSDKAQVGDPVMVVGNPLGLGTSVSTGVVSAVHRDLMNTPIDDYIQTDAAINHGNSGGPVLDRDGKVLAIATILVTNAEGEGSNGLGFAIAGTEAAFTVRHLLHPDVGTVGWIGLHTQDVTPPLQRAFHLPGPGGFLITKVDDDSPADYAGLKAGDVIFKFGDVTPANSREFIRDVIETPINTTVPLTLERDGKSMQADVTIEQWQDLEMPEGSMTRSMESAEAARPPDLGLVLTPISDAARRLYKISSDSGVVVAAVDPTSEAFSDGVVAGDVIKSVQGKAVDTPDQAMQAIQKARTTDQFVALLVAGGDGSTRWLALYSGRPAAAAQSGVTSSPALVSSAPPPGTQSTETAASPKP